MGGPAARKDEGGRMKAKALCTVFYPSFFYLRPFTFRSVLPLIICAGR
jgi:hypothetical protein